MWTHLLCRSTFFDMPAFLPFWMQISTSYLGRPATVYSDAHASSVSCLFNSQTCRHKRIHSTYILTHFQTHSDLHSAVVYQWLVHSRLTCLWLLPRILLFSLYCPFTIVHPLRLVPIVLLFRIGSHPAVYKPAIVLQSSLKLDLVCNTNVLEVFIPCLPIPLKPPSLFSQVLLC